MDSTISTGTLLWNITVYGETLAAIQAQAEASAREFFGHEDPLRIDYSISAGGPMVYEATATVWIVPPPPPF